MESSEGEKDVIIASMPNFRPIEGTGLYRSSRPDELTSEEIKKLKELGIKSIIDLRSPKSWEDVYDREEKLVDQFYPPVMVVPQPDGTLKYEEIKSKTSPKKDDEPTQKAVDECEKLGTHYYLNMVSGEYAIGLIKELPWYRQVQLAGYATTFFTVGHRAVLRKFTEWTLKKPGQTMIVTQYKSMIDYGGKRTKAALKLLSDPVNLPAVVCCMHGKDRTGYISALLQSVSDVPKETIVEGYAASQPSCEKFKEELEGYGTDVGLDESFLSTKPESMEITLQYIDEKYGSVSEYLQSIGVDKEQQETLKKAVKKTSV